MARPLLDPSACPTQSSSLTTRTILFAMGEYFTTQGAEGDCAQGLPSGGCYPAVIADLSLT
jgi:hypothetical protein